MLDVRLSPSLAQLPAAALAQWVHALPVSQCMGHSDGKPAWLQKGKQMPLLDFIMWWTSWFPMVIPSEQHLGVTSARLEQADMNLRSLHHTFKILKTGPK